MTPSHRSPSSPSSPAPPAASVDGSRWASPVPDITQVFIGYLPHQNELRLFPCGPSNSGRDRNVERYEQIICRRRSAELRSPTACSCFPARPFQTSVPEQGGRPAKEKSVARAKVREWPSECRHPRPRQGFAIAPAQGPTIASEFKEVKFWRALFACAFLSTQRARYTVCVRLNDFTDLAASPV